MFACNVRPDLKVGNLEQQNWEDIYNGALAEDARRKVAACQQNCWMVGSARTAMRHPRFTSLPKFRPLWWVVVNKLKVSLGLPINFEAYVDYSHAVKEGSTPLRESYLDAKGIKRTLQRKIDTHYNRFGEFENR